MMGRFLELGLGVDSAMEDGGLAVRYCTAFLGECHADDGTLGAGDACIMRLRCCYAEMARDGRGNVWLGVG
jgi:hypothetical protein